MPLIRDKLNPWLRKTFFPKRDHQYRGEGDTTLKLWIGEHPNPTNPDRHARELELETREWLREFWSRSIAAWIALTISIISVVIAICAFLRH